jgi:glutathione synthase/RimK-type ligase-like ATP-grasp enzyme
MSSYRFRKFKHNIGWTLKTNPLTRGLIINYIRKKTSRDSVKLMDYIYSADKVLIGDCNIRLGIVKDDDNLSFKYYSYWPKFERFAKNNNIPYSFLNIHSDNWINESANYDRIVWRPLPYPSSLYEIRTKIAYIEKFLKIPCYPSAEQLWLYEDKIRLYYHLSTYNLPAIPTFISFDEQECINKLESFEYPLISKSYVGSASMSVSKINNKAEARRHIFKAFSKGLDTGFPYFRQKGYVYFQKYIGDADYDVRIILVGEKIMGYYRMVPKNDFRASGAGLIVNQDLPLEAVLLAQKVKERMPGPVLAIDFLKSRSEDRFYIIETSSAISVDTIGELILNNVPGYYLLNSNALVFHPGRFWLQDLVLEEFLKGSAGKQ